jgi:hypothetical protein
MGDRRPCPSKGFSALNSEEATAHGDLGLHPLRASNARGVSDSQTDSDQDQERHDRRHRDAPPPRLMSHLALTTPLVDWIRPGQAHLRDDEVTIGLGVDV